MPSMTRDSGGVPNSPFNDAARAKVWRDALRTCGGCGTAADVQAALRTVRADARLLPDPPTGLAESGRQAPGRHGPAFVAWEKRESAAWWLGQPSKLGFLSLGNAYEFTTAAAGVQVSRGKWVYEVTLFSSGLLQMGWAVAGCGNTEHVGVGDFLNTYAFDGHRVQKWNVASHPYGTAWEIGDVVSNCIDLDNATIDWYLNGQHLGTAFSDIETVAHTPDGTRSEPLLYIPTVSINMSQLAGVNFGALPLQYPIPGYAPLQSGQDVLLRAATPLCIGLREVCAARLEARVSHQVCIAVFSLVLRRLLAVVDAFRELLPSPHSDFPQHLLAFVWGVWVPFLEHLRSRGDTLALGVVSQAFAAAEPSVSKELWQHTMRVLCFCSSISHHFDVSAHPLILSCNQPVPQLFLHADSLHPTPPQMAYPGSKPTHDAGVLSGGPLAAAGSDPEACFHTTKHRTRRVARQHAVAEHHALAGDAARRIEFEPCEALKVLKMLTVHGDLVGAWVQSPLFYKDLVALCHHKHPNDSVRRLLFPRMWWCGHEDVAEHVAGVEEVDPEGLRADLKSATQRGVIPCDDLRSTIVSQILETGGAARAGVARCIEQCGDDFVQLTDGEGAALTRLLFYLVPAYIPKDVDVGVLYPKAAVLGQQGVATAKDAARAEQFAGIDRLGGLLSHLRSASGGDVPVSDIPPGTGIEREETTEMGVIFEHLILMYHSGVRRHIVRTANCLVERAKAVGKMGMLMREGRLHCQKHMRETVAEVAAATRRCAWEDVMMSSIDRGCVEPSSRPVKQLFSIFLRILRAYEDTPYFPFLPSFILEALVTIVYYRRKSPKDFHAMLESEPELIPFLTRHLHDDRIVHPDLRDTILGVVASVFDMGDPLVCATYRRDETLMPTLIKSVLRCFQDKQSWISSLSILIRLAKHLEFGCVDNHVLLMLVEWTIVPDFAPRPCAVEYSTSLCKQWQCCLLSCLDMLPAKCKEAARASGRSEPSAPQVKECTDNVHEFLKLLFSRIGWALSELTSCLTEQQDLDPAEALSPQQARHMHKKCGMMCDLTRRLFQV